MKGEGSNSGEVRLSVAGRRAVAGAVGASLSLPLAASAFAMPACACGGGGSADAETNSAPAPEEPAASSSQPDAPSLPAHDPSPPRVEGPVIRDPAPAAPEPESSTSDPPEPSTSDSPEPDTPEPSPQVERLLREEQRYNPTPPAEAEEEPDSSESDTPEPSPQVERLLREEQRYNRSSSASAPTESQDAADPPAEPAEPAEQPAEPAEPAEEADPPARPQRYGVDSYLYAHLPPDDQAAIREGYERRTQPQPQQPEPQPQPPEPQPQQSEPQPQPPQPPLSPLPTPEPPAPAPTPSPEVDDRPAATGPTPPAASEPAEAPAETPAPARPQTYGVDSFLYAHLPPDDQAAIREGYERRTQSQPAQQPPEPRSPFPPPAPEWSTPAPTPSPDLADRPTASRPSAPGASEPATEPVHARPRRDGFDTEADGCTPVQGPYLNEADRPCVVTDVPSVPVGQIGTQPEPPESSEPAVTTVGSGGGGGGGGSWGGEEEEEDIVEDKPWWQDGLSAVGDAASWTGEQAVGVGKGAVEGVQGIGEGAVMIYRLSPTNAIIDNESWREEWSGVGDAAQYAWENPSEFGQAVINWEDLEEGRYGEWLGNLAPDAVLAVTTAGTGTAATATTRAVRGADEVADLAEVARDADRAADAADAARDAERAADAADGARPVPDMPRPSWRQSELDVGTDLGPGYEEQLSFLGGRRVPSGTENSVRPDWFGNGEAIEVKNYDVQSVAGRSRLVRVLGEQLRARTENLPAGTSQRVFIDIRGQQLAPAERVALAQRIADNSGGAVGPEQIIFKRR
jgi:hypothetical protein